MFVAALFVTARMVEVEAPARYRSRMHGEMEAGDLPARRFVRLGGVLRRAFALLVDVALPQLCATCREPVEGPGLCPACWSKLSFIAPPYCARLGIPFPFDGGPGLYPWKPSPIRRRISAHGRRCATTIWRAGSSMR